MTLLQKHGICEVIGLEYGEKLVCDQPDPLALDSPSRKKLCDLDLANLQFSETLVNSFGYIFHVVQVAQRLYATRLQESQGLIIAISNL